MSDPFSGHPLSGPGGGGGNRSAPATDPLQQFFGPNKPPIDDPAFQPPRDPLGADTKARAVVINREIPIVTVQTGWSIQQVREALQALVAGQFDLPAQIVDSVVGDSRIQSSMGSLCGGLFSRPIRFTLPKKYEDDDRAKECLDAWQRVWPNLGTEGVLNEMMTWDTFLGFGVAQLLWDTSDPDMWIPHIQPWHPRYTYYHWVYRKYVAITLDGLVPVTAGDGHWILHTPNNPYRGWMKGAVRAVAPWWLARNYALRDWARYSERHGMPIIKAIAPMGADPQQIAAYRIALASLGQESTIQLPQSSDASFGKYDLDFLEASDNAWEGFPGLIEQCNSEITLALQGQNLTSEVKEGSLAAARVHGDVRQSILEAKARGFERTIYQQVMRPFAQINFGDAEIAPRMQWDLSPDEDRKVMALTMLNFAQTLNYFRVAGKKVGDVVALGRTLGLNLSGADFQDVEPLQVEVKGVASGDATSKAQESDDTNADDSEKDEKQ